MTTSATCHFLGFDRTRIPHKSDSIKTSVKYDLPSVISGFRPDINEICGLYIYFTHRTMTVYYRRFGTTYRYRFYDPTGSPEIQ
jgi:hypothetical protein